MLDLAFSSQSLEHTDDTSVSYPLEDEAHPVTALAELILGFVRGEVFNRSSDALGSPATGQTRQPPIGLGLANLSAELLANSRLEHDGGRHIGLIAVLPLSFDRNVKVLPLDDRKHTCKIEVLALGAHPPFPDVHDAVLEDIGSFVPRSTTRHAGWQQLEYRTWDATLLQVNASHVQALRVRVDMARDDVRAEDMAGEGIKPWRRVSEIVGKGDGRERVRIGMRSRIGENHGHGGGDDGKDNK